MPKLRIEQRSIEFIPPAERHGSARTLFAVWFAPNMQITTVVTGSLAVLVGLSLPWALLAIVVGNLFGATIMALHSAQGPKLGIPQMIQSRAQFGVYGATLPLILVLLMYIGFFASSAVLGGQALQSWLGWPIVPSIVVTSAVCTIVAIVGYQLIHMMERVISVIAALTFLYLSVRLLQAPGVGSTWHAGQFHFGIFLLVVAIASTWQITYAPYVADYSRYLPANTPMGAPFWWTYWGSAIGSIWMMAFGSLAASIAVKSFGATPVAYVVDLAPGAVRWLFFIVLLLGVFAVNTMNLYGAFMSATTTLAAIFPMKLNGPTRAFFVLAVAVVSTGVAILGYGNFVANFENFILFLAYFLIPWTAINLADFYFVRKERYDIPSIFEKTGLYGRWNGRALIAYAVGVLVEVPFVSSTFFTGWLVSRLGGADISWILGLIVAGGVYVVLSGPITRREDAWFAERAARPVVETAS
jgi:NCS1 family nucleobase:cation symporter-1